MNVENFTTPSTSKRSSQRTNRLMSLVLSNKEITASRKNMLIEKVRNVIKANGCDLRITTNKCDKYRSDPFFFYDAHLSNHQGEFFFSPVRYPGS